MIFILCVSIMSSLGCGLKLKTWLMLCRRQMKQKYSREGVPLGRDVLSLQMKPEADVSFVMALVAVFGLINGEI